MTVSLRREVPEMEIKYFLLGLFVMSFVTYLVRAVPFGLLQKKITNRFLCSVLYYIPYAVLAAMTFPAVLTSTASVLSAAVGMLVAVILAYRNRGLVLVSLSAAASALLINLLEMLLR